MIRVPRDRHIYAFSEAAPPAVTVPDGAVVELETADCFAGQTRGVDGALAQVDWDRINPATGPVLVEDARPGDVLEVAVEGIEVEGDGIMAVSPDFGVLADRIAATSFATVPIVDGIARLPGGVAWPVEPMVGVLGVTPAGRPVPTGTPGPHGGNLDTGPIGEGATVLLPVFVPGALLAAGDLHALMGDGEVCGTGLEVAGAVRLRLRLRRDLALDGPVVLTADAVATVASAATLDEAAEAATRAMADLLAACAGLDPGTATMLMSAVGQLAVCQVVDPLRTARFSLPLAALAQLGVRPDLSRG